MFNLGTKEVVINNDTSVRESTAPGVGGPQGVITIDGFGEFTIPLDTEIGTRVGAVTAASDAVAGVYTITPGAYDDTKTYDLVLGVRSSRILSNVFSDGDVWTFQSKAGSTDIGSAFAAGQIAGFNDNIVKFSGTTTLIVTFQPGYEGIVIENVVLREVATETSQAYTWAITTAPAESIGLGRNIEEEVQNSTMENLDPYSTSRGPSDVVDIRGKYTEITWSSVAEDEDSPGWRPHEMLGYGDANTDTIYAPRIYTAYVNEASAAATIALLTRLVTGEALPTV